MARGAKDWRIEDGGSQIASRRVLPAKTCHCQPLQDLDGFVARVEWADITVAWGARQTHQDRQEIAVLAQLAGCG